MGRMRTNTRAYEGVKLPPSIERGKTGLWLARGIRFPIFLALKPTVREKNGNAFFFDAVPMWGPSVERNGGGGRRGEGP